MATLSHEAFRKMIEKFGGCDEFYTEMINAGSLLTRGPYEKYYLMNDCAPHKMVWQLTGSKSDLIAEATAEVAKLGGIGIDLNMGCCAPEIISSGAGLAWMLKPIKETQQMVKSVKKVISQIESDTKRKIRLSVKLRLGDENFTDDSFFSFCDMLISEGVELLTLHPRTRKQKYTRPAKHLYVQKLAERLKTHNIKVVLNGDIKDVQSAKNAINTAPLANGIMIAREAATKPWIFAQIKTALQKDALQEKQEIDLYKLVIEYLDDLQVFQPKEFWKTRTQRFFAYFCENFSFSHYFKTQMQNAKDIEDIKNRLCMYFEKVPEDRFIKIGSDSFPINSIN